MAEESRILLESGNNELELLEFEVNGLRYGINVAKVAEIIQGRELTESPESHHAVRGMFSLREKVVSVIDLNRVLFNKDVELNERNIFIVTNFNELDMAFLAENVTSISRYRWSDIKKPDGIISNAETGVITGIVNDGNHLICILDFEKIVSEINPDYRLDSQKIDDSLMNKKKDRSDINLLIAEDSKMLNRLIVDTLKKAGYNVLSTEDGSEAWNLISGCSSAEELEERFQCLITDIEMPTMDGLTLAKNIKSDRRYNSLPIVVFSSLVNEALIRKVRDMNIEVMITKPDIAKLVETIDEIVLN